MPENTDQKNFEYEHFLRSHLIIKRLENWLMSEINTNFCIQIFKKMKFAIRILKENLNKSTATYGFLVKA